MAGGKHSLPLEHSTTQSFETSLSLFHGGGRGAPRGRVGLDVWGGGEGPRLVQIPGGGAQGPPSYDRPVLVTRKAIEKLKKKACVTGQLRMILQFLDKWLFRVLVVRLVRVSSAWRRAKGSLERGG